MVVNTLARAQVMVSESHAPDADTTTVASGGTLTIGGVAVALSGAVTLRGLAAQINATDGIGATASVSETSPGQFRLILTAAETGAANAFTVTNALSGSTLEFEDTDSDGTSGDDAADNAVQATNATLLLNSVPVESASNTLTAAVEGVTITLLKADPDATVVVDVARDNDDLVGRLNAFTTAYNDLAAFADAKLAASGALGRDTLLRSVRQELRNALTAAHGSGDFTRLAEVGLEFTRTGKLTLDEDKLADALVGNPDAVTALFAGGETGAFDAVDDLITSYTRADGFVSSARTRLTDEVSRLDSRIADMEARLLLRRQALQKQFVAADEAMTRLNSQSGTLSNIRNGFGRL
jgi:flagellar hook-associated protein 2